MYYNIIIGHLDTLHLHLKLGRFFKYYVNYDEMLLTPLQRTLIGGAPRCWAATWQFVSVQLIAAPLLAPRPAPRWGTHSPL